MSLQSVITAARDAVQDLTTVEVLTFTGTLDNVVTSQPNGDRAIPWGDLRALKGEVTGKVSLAAATQIDLDYDVVNFRAANLSPDLRQLHDEAVKTSLDSRRAFLEMFKDILLGT